MTLLITTVFLVPLLGTMLLMFFPLKKLQYVSVPCALYSCIILCAYIPEGIHGFTHTILIWMNPLEFTILIDKLALLITLVMSVLFTTVLVFASHMKNRKFHMLILLNFSVLLLSIFSQSLLGFYICIEMAAVITYFLIIHKKTPQSINAGLIYFIFNITGAILILLSIIIRTELPSIAARLFVIGCLIKAGFAPFHIWLARAHPVAPSPVSALLSGIMVKVSIYGIIRFAPTFTVDISLLLIIALLSMLLGVFSALLQSDIKKILAYHTVSQIGFILLGISLMSDTGEIGGLLHLVNHALFKGLLFLCAGAIIYATGTRNLHELGGLAKHMPIPAVACLVGSLAISGIPPFNGYVSKCILYEASPSGYISLIFSITCAGTVASFIKLYWHTFMGSSGKKPPQRAIPFSMKMALLVLSGLCIITGIFAQHILSLVGYQIEIHVWNTAHIPQIALNIGLGVLLYGIGMKSSLIVHPPQIRLSIDRFYQVSGDAVEYAGKKFHDILLQDINYYALTIVFVLAAIYILFSL